VHEEKAPIFFAKVRAVAERTGGRNVEPPLKGMPRCRDKAQFKYKDAGRRHTAAPRNRGLLRMRFLFRERSKDAQGDREIERARAVARCNSPDREE